MSEQLNKLLTELEKRKAEYEIISTCLAQALESCHERLDKVEEWIQEQEKARLR